MGLKRLLLFVVLAAGMSLGLASSAPAGNYDEQRMGCTGESPATCPTGTEGQAYSIPIEMLGDEDESCAAHRVSSGTFPPGLRIADGPRIEGTPTQAGMFRFYLTATLDCPYPCGSKCTSDDEFIIPINPGLARLTIGPESTTPGTRGAQYALQMTASVADAKTWTINSGQLPTGLVLDANTGLISGTPTETGEFTFEVRAKVNADIRTDTKVLGIVVRDPLAIAAEEPFSPTRRAVGEVSAPFEAMLTASGGSGTYTWSLSEGELPTGLLFADGAISGTPRVAGVYLFTVSLSDTEGRATTYPTRIVVAEKLTVSTLLLRPGKVGKLYQAKLRAIGGIKPVSWRITRGPLPRGVRFDRITGQLSGIPKRAGSFRVTFQATDELGVLAAKTLRIVVAAAPKPKPKSSG